MRICYLSLEEGQRYDSLVMGLDDERLAELLTADLEVPDMEWHVIRNNGGRHLAFECRHRGGDGLCGIYDDRPGMCRGFSCAALDGEESLEDFKARKARPDGEADEVHVREVTDRVNEILGRRARGLRS